MAAGKGTGIPVSSGGNFSKIRQIGQRIEFRSQPGPEASVLPLLQSYFRLDDDIQAIYAEIRQDPRVADMVDLYPGLRLLRIEPWECLVSFICSANSNIPRIHQNMEMLSKTFGDTRAWTCPAASSKPWC